MTTALLLAVLLAVLVDLGVDVVALLPRRRRALEREDASRAVAIAEQLHRGAEKAGEAKARAATAYMLELHPKMKASRARLLVEGAVSELKK